MSTKTAAEFLTFPFPFSCLYNSRVSFSFCLKVCAYEYLEALFLKSCMKIEMICTLTFTFPYKTRELSLSRSVSKENGGKVARWLHSHVQGLYSVTLSIFLQYVAKQVAVNMLLASQRCEK